MRFAVDDVVGSLPDPPDRQLPPRPRPPRSRGAGDPLRDLPPDVYVAALTGRPVRRDRKIACPLHEERTPSLHVYPAPEQGWYCFGLRPGRIRL